MSNQGRGISARRAWMRPVAVLVAVVMLAEACTSWAVTSEPVPSVLAKKPDTRIRATMQGGAVIEIVAGRIVGDSLVGFTGNSPSRIAVALADVKRVEIRKGDAAKTTGLVVAVGASLLLIAVAVAAATVATYSPPPVSTTGTSSCPLVYSWDGTNWRLDSGTFGGAIMRALQRTDMDNLEHAAPADGVLRLKVANDLNETDYVDALHVLAVDHDSTVTAAPDAAGRIHTLGALSGPIGAVDFRGRDARARVAQIDDWNWESAPSGRDSAKAADVRDGLDLTFVRPPNASHAHLVLDGSNTPWSAFLLGQFIAAHGAATQAWYDSLNANPLQARAMGTQIAREAFLNVAVKAGDAWAPQGMFWEAGPEVRKRQVLDLDLARVHGDTVHVRMESVPMFWLVDRVAIDFSEDQAVTVSDLELMSARDREDHDVRGLLTNTDDRYYALRTGDAAELQYKVPKLAPGVARTFVLRSTGWYHVNAPVTASRDADMLWRIAHAPLGLSRVAVGRLNDALHANNGPRR